MGKKSSKEISKRELEKKIFERSELALIGKEALEELKNREIARNGRITVSADDVKMFLRLAAKGHRSFFKYMRLAYLKAFLKSKCLVLSRMSEMNDWTECSETEDADKIYLGCLSYGSMENMAMWKMYGGGPEDVAVRLEFKGTDVRKCLGEKGKCCIYRGEWKDGRLVKGKLVEESDVDGKSFHDVAYFYGKALMWDRKVVGKSRCSDVLEPRNFATYAKNFGWANENEVRFVVKLKERVPGLTHLLVDFESAMKNMKILIGPRISPAARVCRIMRESDFGIDEQRISESQYEADLWR